jgi:hypothetical protein
MKLWDRKCNTIGFLNIMYSLYSLFYLKYISLFFPCQFLNDLKVFNIILIAVLVNSCIIPAIFWNFIVIPPFLSFSFGMAKWLRFGSFHDHRQFQIIHWYILIFILFFSIFFIFDQFPVILHILPFLIYHQFIGFLIGKIPHGFNQA